MDRQEKSVTNTAGVSSFDSERLAPAAGESDVDMVDQSARFKSRSDLSALREVDSNLKIGGRDPAEDELIIKRERRYLHEELQKSWEQMWKVASQTGR